jgi:diguanylate cyclase (GGDEF)-like protein/PAS domain S-box-containing protein
MSDSSQSEPRAVLQGVLQSIRDAVVTTDAEGRVQTLNAAAETLTGWTQIEALGHPVEEIINLRAYGTDAPLPNPAYESLREGKDGRRIHIHLEAKPLVESDPEACLLVFYDASEAVRLAERISYLGQHDPLTGLPNRILLVDRLEQGTRLADRTSDQLAVVFLDLDHFHRINETCGHALADQFLKEVAYRLTDALRESDTVCRLGGDEFVLLLRGVRTVTNVESLAAKLLREIARPFPVDGHIIESSCSLGISVYPRDAMDGQTLMHLADGAMHRAKQQGRNRYLFARQEGPQALSPLRQATAD